MNEEIEKFKAGFMDAYYVQCMDCKGIRSGFLENARRCECSDHDSSKREDSSQDEMRYSEQQGNLLREVQ